MASRLQHCAATQQPRQPGASRLRQARRPGIATGRDAARKRGLRAPSRCSIEPARLKWPTDSTHPWMKNRAQVKPLRSYPPETYLACAPCCHSVMSCHRLFDLATRVHRPSGRATGGKPIRLWEIFSVGKARGTLASQRFCLKSPTAHRRDAMGRAARMAISSLTSIDGVSRCPNRTI
jgi:hypothetical protein